METEPKRSGELAPGDVVAGRYRLGRKLGEGGMGVVYEAEHLELRRAVALKVLLPWRTESQRIAARFKQEARIAAALGHPGIVEVFDLGEDEGRGQTFIAMELLQGEELRSRIHREGPLPVDFVVRVGIELADAVAAAHERGIIHRDLKPANVFLARRGRQQDVVKVLDFGLAKLVEAAGDDPSITKSGDFFGTPLFMSPEQLRSPKDVDGRTDLYAIGVLLYEALAGTPPYSAESVAELILKVATQQPTPLAALRPRVPEPLVRVVERAMHKDRTLRFQSATELRDALEACAGAKAGEPRAQPPLREPSSQAQDLCPTVSCGSDPGGAAAEGDPGARGAQEQVATLPELPPPTLDREVGEAVPGPVAEGPLPHAAEPAEAPPRPRRGSLVLAGSLSLLALLLGGAGVARLLGAWGSGTGEPLARPASPQETAAVPDAGGPGEAGAAGPAAPAPDRAELRRRTVRLVTDPAGARILVDGVPRCIAPCQAELEEAGAVVTALLEGYDLASEQVRPPLPESVEIRLRPRQGRGQGSPLPQQQPRTKQRPDEEEGEETSPPPLLPR